MIANEQVNMHSILEKKSQQLFYYYNKTEKIKIKIKRHFISYTFYIF